MRKTLNLRLIPFRKAVAGTLAIALTASSVLAPAAQANFWQERREAMGRQNASDAQTQMARLPADVLPAVGNPLQGLPGSAPTDQTVVTRHMRFGDELRRLPAFLSSLPAAYGDIRDVSLSSKKDAPLVVLIQDVHGVGSAQANIAGMLNHFSEAASDRLLIGMEGAAGSFEVSKYRGLKFPDAHREVNEMLFERTILTGAEFFALTAKNEPLLWGVEDADLYKKNLAAYRASLAGMEAQRRALEALQDAAAQLRATLFTPALTALDDRLAGYHRGETGLVELVNAFPELKNDAFPQINLFRQALELEKSLDFKQVEKERAHLIQVMGDKLSKAELEDLVRVSISYRAGDLTHAAYYAHLKTLLSRQGLSLSGTPAFDKYVRYVLAADKIDPSRLFTELQSAQDTAARALAATPQARALFDARQDLRLADKILRHELTTDEWERYQARSPEIHNISRTISSLSNGAPALAPLDLSVYEEFYDAAVRRNTALTDNLLSKAGSSMAVLIAGGFHTGGLAQELKKRGASTITLTPKLDKIEGRASDYLNVFSGRRTPLEKILLGEKLMLASTPEFASSLDGRAKVAPQAHAAVAPALAAAQAAEAQDLAAGRAALAEALEDIRQALNIRVFEEIEPAGEGQYAVSAVVNRDGVESRMQLHVTLKEGQGNRQALHDAAVNRLSRESAAEVQVLTGAVSLIAMVPAAAPAFASTARQSAPAVLDAARAAVENPMGASIAPEAQKLLLAVTGARRGSDTPFRSIESSLFMGPNGRFMQALRIRTLASAMSGPLSTPTAVAMGFVAAGCVNVAVDKSAPEERPILAFADVSAKYSADDLKAPPLAPAYYTKSTNGQSGVKRTPVTNADGVPGIRLDIDASASKGNVIFGLNYVEGEKSRWDSDEVVVSKTILIENNTGADIKGFINLKGDKFQARTAEISIPKGTNAVTIRLDAKDLASDKAFSARDIQLIELDLTDIRRDGDVSIYGATDIASNEVAPPADSAKESVAAADDATTMPEGERQYVGGGKAVSITDEEAVFELQSQTDSEIWIQKLPAGSLDGKQFVMSIQGGAWKMPASGIDVKMSDGKNIVVIGKLKAVPVEGSDELTPLPLDGTRILVKFEGLDKDQASSLNVDQVEQLGLVFPKLNGQKVTVTLEGLLPANAPTGDAPLVDAVKESVAKAADATTMQKGVRQFVDGGKLASNDGHAAVFTLKSKGDGEIWIQGLSAGSLEGKQFVMSVKGGAWKMPADGILVKLMDGAGNARVVGNLKGVALDGSRILAKFELLDESYVNELNVDSVSQMGLVFGGLNDNSISVTLEDLLPKNAPAGTKPVIDAVTESVAQGTDATTMPKGAAKFVENGKMDSNDGHEAVFSLSGVGAGEIWIQGLPNGSLEGKQFIMKVKGNGWVMPAEGIEVKLMDNSGNSRVVGVLKGVALDGSRIAAKFESLNDNFSETLNLTDVGQMGLSFGELGGNTISVTLEDLLPKNAPAGTKPAIDAVTESVAQGTDATTLPKGDAKFVENGKMASNNGQQAVFTLAGEGAGEIWIQGLPDGSLEGKQFVMRVNGNGWTLPPAGIEVKLMDDQGNARVVGRLEGVLVDGSRVVAQFKFLDENYSNLLNTDKVRQMGLVFGDLGTNTVSVTLENMLTIDAKDGVPASVDVVSESAAQASDLTTMPKATLSFLENGKLTSNNGDQAVFEMQGTGSGTIWLQNFPGNTSLDGLQFVMRIDSNGSGWTLPANGIAVKLTDDQGNSRIVGRLQGVAVDGSRVLARFQALDENYGNVMNVDNVRQMGLVFDNLTSQPVVVTLEKMLAGDTGSTVTAGLPASLTSQDASDVYQDIGTIMLGQGVSYSAGKFTAVNGTAQHVTRWIQWSANFGAPFQFGFTNVNSNIHGYVNFAAASQTADGTALYANKTSPIGVAELLGVVNTLTVTPTALDISATAPAAVFALGVELDPGETAEFQILEQDGTDYATLPSTLLPPYQASISKVWQVWAMSILTFITTGLAGRFLELSPSINAAVSLGAATLGLAAVFRLHELAHQVAQRGWTPLEFSVGGISGWAALPKLLNPANDFVLNVPNTTGERVTATRLASVAGTLLLPAVAATVAAFTDQALPWLAFAGLAAAALATVPSLSDDLGFSKAEKAGPDTTPEVPTDTAAVSLLGIQTALPANLAQAARIASNITDWKNRSVGLQNLSGVAPADPMILLTQGDFRLMEDNQVGSSAIDSFIRANAVKLVEDLLIHQQEAQEAVERGNVTASVVVQEINRAIDALAPGFRSSLLQNDAMRENVRWLRQMAAEMANINDAQRATVDLRQLEPGMVSVGFLYWIAVNMSAERPVLVVTGSDKVTQALKALLATSDSPVLGALKEAVRSNSPLLTFEDMPSVEKAAAAKGLTKDLNDADGRLRLAIVHKLVGGQWAQPAAPDGRKVSHRVASLSPASLNLSDLGSIEQILLTISGMPLRILTDSIEMQQRLNALRDHIAQYA